MNKQKYVQQISNNLFSLPENKVVEVADFVHFLMEKMSLFQKEEEKKDLSLSDRRAFMDLPMEERRQIMEEQAEEIRAHYEQNTEWEKLQGGDIVEY